MGEVINLGAVKPKLRVDIAYDQSKFGTVLNNEIEIDLDDFVGSCKRCGYLYGYAVGVHSPGHGLVPITISNSDLLSSEQLGALRVLFETTVRYQNESWKEERGTYRARFDKDKLMVHLYKFEIA